MKTSIVQAFTVVASLFAGTALAANVDVRLSTREAYVGSPIVLQVSISDASDYQQPKIPPVDGYEIRSAGAPSQSSQITIINGRRSESRSVSMRYLITPHREGTFEIPSLEIVVDGKTVTTNPLTFVATKSVTGDLLFVEIAGGKEKVFVGQPLELTLKIWLKPYRDNERNLTLSEGDMWQMISEQTSWGGFADRMKELAENNQRPGGSEVLRDDGQGNNRSYYLYEIKATVYPKRPGKIDAEDVQVIVNYPTALGRSRSPLSGFFDNDNFGSRSRLSQMMGDDVFGSPLGSRLAVTSTRPLVGEISVDATQVVPVPEEGRPADYRGAVGRYQIMTQATPTTVDVGDPLTLNIAIIGTGPMELVQAPPLSELPPLTADFKVADESLAGFVQNDTKLFTTTIRPRREGIREVPAIRFSFFDPETETFETATSQSIPITVNQSESLALDAIIGKPRANTDPTTATTPTDLGLAPDYTNHRSRSALVSQVPPANPQWWWFFVIAPPCVWLATWLWTKRNAMRNCLMSLRPAQANCLTSLERATDNASITTALTQYIEKRSGTSSPTARHAIGTLRVLGMYEIAAEVESYLHYLTGDLSPVKREQAIVLVKKLESSFNAMKKTPVRWPKQSLPKVNVGNLSQRSISLLYCVTLSLASHNALASQSLALSVKQQEIIFDEANASYLQAMEFVGGDAADAQERFETAAKKYQLLVDSGLHNRELYFNLGNAYLQSGELGRAIANYERARWLDPNNQQLLANLKSADARVRLPAVPAPSVGTSVVSSIIQRLRSANDAIVQFIGGQAVAGTLVVSSILFWALLIVRTTGTRFPVVRYAAIPLLMLLASLGSMLLTTADHASRPSGIVVVNRIRLHAGDGEQFDEVASIDAAQGHRVAILAHRGQWTQVLTTQGQLGWAHSENVERLAESS